MALSVTFRPQTWPLASAFVISRGAKTEAAVIVVEIGDGRVLGRGECVPYARYGETIATVSQQIADAASHPALVGAATSSAARAALQSILPAGAARNGLDCALWEFQAKESGTTVAALTGQPTDGCEIVTSASGLADPIIPRP